MSTLFDAMMAWHQIGLLAGGLLLVGLGGLLLGWLIQQRLTGRKVTATVVAVRMTPRRKSSNVQSGKGSYSGEMYWTVLEYVTRSGETVRAEA